MCHIATNNKIPLKQYYRLHSTGHKIDICETVLDAVFVLDIFFTHKDHLFEAALQEAMDSFNAVLFDFEYHQQFERYDTDDHSIIPKSNHPFYRKYCTNDNSTLLKLHCLSSFVDSSLSIMTSFSLFFSTQATNSLRPLCNSNSIRFRKYRYFILLHST